MHSLFNKRIYLVVLFSSTFAQCAQHIMQLPDDVLTYIGQSVFIQSTPTVILSDLDNNQDEEKLADIDIIYATLNNINNDFYALRATNKKLYLLLSNIAKNYCTMINQTRDRTVSADSFFTYCFNNTQLTDKNDILLTAFKLSYQIPLKSNWFIKLCRLKPTFPERIQGNCVLHKSFNQKGVYCQITTTITNNNEQSFIQKIFQRSSSTPTRIALLAQLLDQCLLLEKLYPYLEFFKMFQYNGTDLGRESSFKCEYNLKEKHFTDGMKIEKQYVLNQKFTIPISKIPIDVFLECIKK